MKFWRAFLVVVGLLLVVTSCGKKEVSKDETEEFLAGLSTTFAQAMMSEANQVLYDFTQYEPPLPGVSSYVPTLEASLTMKKLRGFRQPPGFESLYGTWEYDVDSACWVHKNPNNPSNGILFLWVFIDTVGNSHPASLFVDSFAFYQDTLPKKVWAKLGLDNKDLAWIKFKAEYNSPEEIKNLSLIYEIIGCFQIGFSILTPIAINTLDSEFVGTLRFWAINRKSNDYRVDLTLTRKEDDSGVIVLEDSDDWKMTVNISKPIYEGDYEKRTVKGEITKDGAHAADIEGVIWDPEDMEHQSVVMVIFSDGSEEPLATYLPIEDIEL
ncbi:MAG: hypothetical protein ABIN61_01000 [candidate division WOR-3 bacterium]